MHLVHLATNGKDTISFMYDRNLTRSYHRWDPTRLLKNYKNESRALARVGRRYRKRLRRDYRSDESANSPSSSRWNRFAVFSRLHSSRYDNRILSRNFSIHGYVITRLNDVFSRAEGWGIDRKRKIKRSRDTNERNCNTLVEEKANIFVKR